MRTNLIALNNAIAPLITEPFFVLDHDKQRLIRETLIKIFSMIWSDLENHATGSSLLLPLIDDMLVLLKKSKFDDYEFACNLNNFFVQVIAKPTHIEKIVLGNICLMSNRAKLFSYSEKVAAEARTSMACEQVRRHDLEILEDSMQIYALDYFLFIYMSLVVSAPEARLNIIYNGLGGAPGLKNDALENDMLKKVIFDLYSKELRQSMIIDYFIFRRQFVDLVESQSCPSEKILATIVGLKKYILSLIDVSLAWGITDFKHSLFKPMGELTDLRTIKERLLIL